MENWNQFPKNHDPCPSTVITAGDPLRFKEGVDLCHPDGKGFHPIVGHFFCRPL